LSITAYTPNTTQKYSLGQDRGTVLDAGAKRVGDAEKWKHGSGIWGTKLQVENSGDKMKELTAGVNIVGVENAVETYIEIQSKWIFEWYGQRDSPSLGIYVYIGLPSTAKQTNWIISSTMAVLC